MSAAFAAATAFSVVATCALHLQACCEGGDIHSRGTCQVAYSWRTKFISLAQGHRTSCDRCEETEEDGGSCGSETHLEVCLSKEVCVGKYSPADERRRKLAEKSQTVVEEDDDDRGDGDPENSVLRGIYRLPLFLHYVRFLYLHSTTNITIHSIPASPSSQVIILVYFKGFVFSNTY
jgi:hypothetical protein